MADISFFPAPGAPLPTADTVVGGHAGGIPAGGVGTPWPEGIPTVDPATALPPPGSGDVQFYRTPMSVGQGSAYIGLGAFGAPAQIPATGREGPLRTVLLDTPTVRFQKTAADRTSESELAAAATASAAVVYPQPEPGLLNDVLAGIDEIPADALAVLTGEHFNRSNR